MTIKIAATSGYEENKAIQRLLEYLEYNLRTDPLHGFPAGDIALEALLQAGRDIGIDVARLMPSISEAVDPMRQDLVKECADEIFDQAEGDDYRVEDQDMIDTGIEAWEQKTDNMLGRRERLAVAERLAQLYEEAADTAAEDEADAEP